jgi:UDP-2,3-diacylglucosamine pyrophosphatase LpxH
MILIVSDVHEEIVRLKSILKQYPNADQIIFLGDWFDSWAGLTWQTHETVKWLAENIGNPKYVFLWGNHDMHYAFPFDGVMCSGFDKNKLAIVRQHLNDNDHWKKFKLMHWIGTPANDEELGNVQSKEWLISHAGIHPSLLNPFLGFDKQSLLALEEEAMWKLRYCQQVTSLLAAGRGRDGPARVGGVDWLDWSTEFIPINGLNQIVGHSYGKEVRCKQIPDSINYCIDTHLRHVIEVDNGSIKIKFI